MRKKQPSYDIQKNELAELEITGMTSEGLGVGRYKDIPVFIPLSAVGDRLLVRMIKLERRFIYGRIERILSPAASRIEADCPYFAQCGGCCYRHIDYTEELRVKQEKVMDAITRIGHLPAESIEPIVPAPSRIGYRNKAILPLGAAKDGRLLMGYYALNSHRIINCDACMLHPDEFNQIMELFRQWYDRFHPTIYDERTKSGLLRRLYLRKAEATGKLLVTVVINGTCLPYEKALCDMLVSAVPSIAGVLLNRNQQDTNVALGHDIAILYGTDHLTDTICDMQFLISPLSFYQVNRKQAEALYRASCMLADPKPEDLLLDLYCGTGTIGLTMAKKAGALWGVELVEDAVSDAKKNAETNSISNARFIRGDAAAAAAELQKKSISPSIILIDPPRKGCSPALIQTILDFHPEKILYISCDPATLARDLRLFCAGQYQIHTIRPYDFFPATAHVECVVLLSKKNKE